MPTLSPEERFEARADGFIFTLFQWFRFLIGAIFFLGIVMVSGRAVIIGLLALIEKLRPDHARMPDPPPSVTVLLPPPIQERLIVQAVTSVLISHIPSFHLSLLPAHPIA